MKGDETRLESREGGCVFILELIIDGTDFRPFKGETLPYYHEPRP